MKETIFNLQCDWDGLLEWYGVDSFEARRKIKEMIVSEVDYYRNRSLWKRIINDVPTWNPFVKK